MKTNKHKEHIAKKKRELGLSDNRFALAKIPAKKVVPVDTPEIHKEIERHIGIIRGHFSALVECAKSIAWFQTTNSYLLVSPNWKVFCAENFGYSMMHIHRIQKAAATIAELRMDPKMSKWVDSLTNHLSNHPILTNEEQALAIAKVPKADREKVLELATESVGTKLTAKTIKHFATKVAAEKVVEKEQDISPNPWPAKVAHAIEFREIVSGIIKTVRSGLGELDKHYQSGFAIHFPAGQITDQIRKLLDQVKAALPFADCPGCESKGCPACKDQGWLTKTSFNALPDDVRDKSVVIGAI